MSSIIFSFDAQAVGLLGALDAISAGLESLMSTVENVASSFADINAGAETLTAAMTNMFANFSSISGAADQTSQSFGNASKSASDLAYQLQQLAERASDAASSHADAVEQIEEQESDLTQNTKEQIQQRTDAFNQSMQNLVESHQNAVDQINDQQQNLTENYYDQMNSTLVKMNDPIALQHKQLVTSLQQQIDYMLASGNTSGIAALQNQLNTENQKYQSYLTNTIEPYYKALDQKAYDHYHNQLDALAEKLKEENQKYNQQTQYLQSKYQQDLLNLQNHYAQSEQRLQEHLAKENQMYAQQMQRIAEERQHIIDSASGGSGGGAGDGTDTGGLTGPLVISLLQKLGINPMKSPAAASQAILDWILGIGKAGHSDPYNPNGLAFGTEMTIPQVEALVNQALALGKDPTKQQYGKENYVNIFADLLAFTSATAPTRTQDDRFSSLMQIMEKVLSGNTTGLMRQFANLGISPQLLSEYGIKFGGTTGKSIENPQDLFNSLMKMTGSVAGGLGQQFGTMTFTGVVNQFKDLWYRAAQEIGDPGNPKGLWSQFRNNLTEILLFLLSHQGDFVNFGKTIFSAVNGAFHAFNQFVTGPQGAALMHDIANGFKAIGDALAWAGQHKDIIMMIASLLAMQAGTKMLQAGAGGVMGIASSFFGGGMTGPIMDLIKGGGAAGGGAGGGLMSLLGNLGSGAAGRFGAGQNTGYEAGFIKDLIERYGGLGAAVSGVGGRGIGALPGETLLETLARGTGTGLGATRIGAIAGGAGAEAGGSMLGGLINTGMGAAGGIGSFAAGIGPSIGGALGGIAPFLASLPALISGAVSALGPLLLGFAAAAGPILLVAGAIAGLVAVIVMNRERIKPFVDMLVHFFGTQLKDAEKALSNFAQQVESRLGPAFGPGSLVYKGLMFFEQLWVKMWPGIERVFEGVWNVISGVIRIAWSIISGIILIGLDILGGKWGKVWTDIQTMLSGVWGGIVSILKGAWQIISGVVIGALAGIWHVIQSSFSLVWNLIWGVISNVGKFWSDLWLKTIPNVVTGAIKWVLDHLAQLGKGIGDFFTNTIPTALGNALGAAAKLMKSLVDHLIDSFLPGPLAASVHSALHFAEGGFYPGQNKLAVVGERGPELFFSNSGGTVVSNDAIRKALLGIDLRTVGQSSNNSGNGCIVIAGNVILNGVQDPADFYRKLNKAAGLRAEFGRRGSSL